MEDDAKDLFVFRGMTCDVEDTLEPDICRKVLHARNELVEALRDTRHKNRDTHTLRRSIEDLDLIIIRNTKDLKIDKDAIKKTATTTEDFTKDIEKLEKRISAQIFEPDERMTEQERESVEAWNPILESWLQSLKELKEKYKNRQ